MMNRSAWLSFVLMCLCTWSWAVEKDAKYELAYKIMELQGVREIVDQQNRQLDESLKAQAEQIYQQMVAANGGKEVPGARSIHDAFFASASWLVPTDDLLARWVESYSKQMTIEDLKIALAYYSSPTGQREVAVNKQVAVELMGWILGETQKAADKAFVDYIRNLQVLSSKRPGVLK